MVILPVINTYLGSYSSSRKVLRLPIFLAVAERANPHGYLAIARSQCESRVFRTRSGWNPPGRASFLATSLQWLPISPFDTIELILVWSLNQEAAPSGPGIPRGQSAARVIEDFGIVDNAGRIGP